MSGSDSHAEAFRRMVLSVLSKRVAKAYKEAHGDDSFLGRGDRISVTNPFDDRVKLGTVTKTDPDDKADITNVEAFTAWMAENYPEQVHQPTRIVGTNAEVIRVLAEHAPHLIAEGNVKVRDWAAGAVLRLSAAAGKPVGPGGEADIPGVAVTPGESGLQVRPGKNAEQVIAELWQSGLLELDGTVRPALPAAEDDTPPHAA